MSSSSSDCYAENLGRLSLVNYTLFACHNSRAKDKVTLSLAGCYMDSSTESNSVWFPQWAEVLNRWRLPELRLRAYRQAVLAYLRFCKQSRQRATVDSARQFIVQVEGQRQLGSSQLATWKEALNWFFKAAKQGGSQGGKIYCLIEPAASGRAIKTTGQMAVPPLAATDLGGPEWERKLIRELRIAALPVADGQTYRMWASRFARLAGGRRRVGV